MDTFDLEVAKSPSSGYHLEYNDELPAATLNSVGSAILPFLLSMLPPKINYYDSVRFASEMRPGLERMQIEHLAL